MTFVEGHKAFKYEPRKLPKHLIPYPREDMSKEVFSLFNLKNPLPYWSEKGDQAPGNDQLLNDLDKDLFKNQEKDELKIQVLTNKPRTVFYVAAVNKIYPAKLEAFSTTYAMSKGVKDEADYFNQMARAEKAQQFRAAAVEQLRHKYLKNINPEGYSSNQ